MKNQSLRHLSETSFAQDFVNTLPGDPITEITTRQVTEAFYSHVKPAPTKQPKLLAWSEEVAARFHLARPAAESEDVQILSGNLVTPSMKPYAALYGGHQFGNWAGQLGDGRAMTLGEITDVDGKSWDLQLKGAGPTPYSRRADGRAVLRSSLREFLCSEAMFHLGVATTRALSLVTTGDLVVRDMFYDGHPEREPGAITARMAPSFIRFGNFEIFAARGDLKNLKLLADYVIDRHYPHLKTEGENRIPAFFREVCERTIRMGVDWMRVGFVHGVMNTDNMSILGLTIDYGPYGWLDNYDPSWTPNTTDLPGRRYAYGAQPSIIMWNLLQLANALAGLASDKISDFETILQNTENQLGELFVETMGKKLGLETFDPTKDMPILENLDGLMRESEIDMTLFYRGLATLSLTESSDALPAFLTAASYIPDALQGELKTRWHQWLTNYRARTIAEKPDLTLRAQKMNAVNPLYVPRNYLAQECIDLAAQGDTSLLEEFMKVLKNPYVEQAGAERFAAKRPDWAKSRAGCSTLSCSS